MRRSVPQGTGSGQTEGKGSRKATPAERVRGELMEAVGEASLNFSVYCRLAAQAMLQTAMEVEAAEFIGRVTYQRRGEDQSTCRNGYKTAVRGGNEVTSSPGYNRAILLQTKIVTSICHNGHKAAVR